MENTKLDYETKRDDLFKRWKEARPEYIINGKFFSHDGIADFDNWAKSKLKILFLLKENHADIEDWEPWEGITTNSNTFSLNIGRWYQILNDLYIDSSKELSFSNIILPETIYDIALVEVKKLNEGKTSSDPKEINLYADNDKEFLKEQIDLINPNIILCCSTYYAYKIIYENESQLELNEECFKHNERLIIKFYHPSVHPAAKKHSKDLFEELCEIIKDGNVFEKFEWCKK